MPVEVESSGQLSEVGRVLRRRTAWIVVPFVLIATLGTAFAVIVPKKYVATTEVMVHDVRGAGEGDGREQGLVATHHIRSRKKVEAIILQDLKWPYKELSRVEQEDLIEKVLDNLDVDAPSMGLRVSQQLVRISYADTDRNRAYEFLSKVSERWQQQVLEAARNAKIAEFNNLRATKLQAEKREKQIGDYIADILRTNGIPPWNPDEDGDRMLDPAFGQLTEAKKREAELREEMERLALDLEEARRRYELMEDEVPYEFTEGGADFSEQIVAEREAIVEAQLAIERQGYKSTHSRYKQLQEEIRQHEEVIRLLEESSRVGIADAENGPNTDKLELGQEMEEDRAQLERLEAEHTALLTEIANLEARTKELQAVYQELDRLMSERERLHENLITIGEDHNAMRREMEIMRSSAGNPFTVKEDPKLPVRPTRPDPILIVVFSVLAGLAVGLGLGLLLEYSRSCFRSVNDITRVMVVPVLGVVNHISTYAERRRAFVTRVAVSGATASFVLVVGFVTWAWAVRPDLLSGDLRQSIDALRASFE